MQDWFSAKELLGLPGMPTTIRGIRITAQRKNWPYEQKGHSGPGRKENLYALAVLPSETQAYLHSIYKEQNGSPKPDNGDRTGDSGDNLPDPSPVYISAAVEHTELVGGQIAPILPTLGKEKPATKPQGEPRAVGRPKGRKGEAKMDAWLAIIKAWEGYKKLPSELSIVQREYAFEAAYQRREIDVSPEVYETVSNLSRATLCRKRVELSKKGVTALAGKEGAGRPK